MTYAHGSWVMIMVRDESSGQRIWSWRNWPGETPVTTAWISPAAVRIRRRSLVERTRIEMLRPERFLKNRWARVFLPILGAASFLWFLIRVGPKPSRAAYPCQQVAAPLAGTFVVWVTSVVLWILGRRKAFEFFRKSRLALGMACLIVAIGSLALAISLLPQRAVVASNAPPP